MGPQTRSIAFGNPCRCHKASRAGCPCHKCAQRPHAIALYRGKAQTPVPESRQQPSGNVFTICRSPLRSSFPLEAALATNGVEPPPVRYWKRVLAVLVDAGILIHAKALPACQGLCSEIFFLSLLTILARAGLPRLCRLRQGGWPPLLLKRVCEKWHGHPARGVWWHRHPADDSWAGSPCHAEPAFHTPSKENEA